MKKYLVIIICFTWVFMVLSCSKELEDITGVEFDTENFHKQADFIMKISIDSEIPIFLISKKLVKNSKMVINGIELEHVWYMGKDIDENDESDGNVSVIKWYCAILQDDLPLDLSALTEISAYLKINDQKIDETLLIPSKPIAEFQDIDFAQDYSFSWDLAEEPDTQLVELKCGSLELLYYYRNEWEIASARRDFTISNYYFGACSTFDEVDYTLSLESINYKTNTKFVIYTARKTSISEIPER